MKLAVIGTGRMGGAVAQLAPGHQFSVTTIGSAEVRNGGITKDLLRGADVAIEFTVAAAAPGIIRDCARAGCPVVSGTTGWDEQRAAVEADVRSSPGALVWAPNFAIGARIFARLAKEAGKQFAHAPVFDARITETHHATKKDAPSGTAKLLRAELAASLGRDVPINSIREGTVTGTHQITFDAPFEVVRLEHEAKDRRVFAAGALVAARWLIGKRGVFTLDDVVTSL